MGESTKIQWTDHTFNPWWGCQRVSPGCEHCYAEAFDRRLGGQHWGATTERRFFGDKHWNEPKKWNAVAEREGVRRRVFCASMADVFEDRPDLVAQRDRLLALIRETPWLDWLLLTKRPENIEPMLPSDWGERGYENVWLGTTVEDRKRLERIQHLVDVPCAVRFLSCEPLLEDIADELRSLLVRNPNPVAYPVEMQPALLFIDWIIVGGESGPRAEPFDMTWARNIMRTCRDAGVYFFMKQAGDMAIDSDWGLAPLDLKPKGDDPDQWRPDLRVREFPRGNRTGAF
jgi:protein gp37